MTTISEYALLAGASYYDTRPQVNRFPLPTDWIVISRVPQDGSTGFEASAFKNSLTNEVVISYAGTDPGDITGDIAADIGLATGYGAAQLTQAADFYLQVRAAYSAANITLAGHSLGGGLAALVGVFFDVKAYTFDQAPFANSAQSNGDTIRDSDGKGSIYLNGKHLTLATRKEGETAYKDDAGNIYLLSGDGNGFAECTGWVNSGDGILVRDLNEDGRISTGAEFFGDQTLLKNCQLCANGFAALADLDDNRGGTLDSQMLNQLNQLYQQPRQLTPAMQAPMAVSAK